MLLQPTVYLLLVLPTAAFVPAASFQNRVASSSVFSTTLVEHAANHTHHDTNPVSFQQIKKLAEQAGDPSQKVVKKAFECEQLWKESSHHDTDSLNIVLKAWSKCAQTLSETTDHSKMLDPSVPVYTTRDAIQRATDFLHASEEPNTQSYNYILEAWAKSRLSDATTQAETIWDEMIGTVEPDLNSYNALLDVWTFSDNADKIDKLHAILKDMKRQQKTNPSIRFNTRTMNSILLAYSRAANDRNPAWAEKAKKVFQDMQAAYETTKDITQQPDAMSYSALMDVHAKLGQAQEAEELYKEMKATKDPRFAPTIYTYTALMNAWSYSRQKRAPYRALELVQELLNDKSITNPNPRPLSGAIQCWAYSQESNKAKKALEILQLMRSQSQEGYRPDVITYNVAIDCCARTKGSSEDQLNALKIAFAIFKAAKKDTKPTFSTFSTLLRCPAYLLPAGKEQSELAKSVFQQAITAGEVNADVIHNLQKACDADTFQILLAPMTDSNGHVHYDRIPAEWRKGY